MEQMIATGLQSGETLNSLLEEVRAERRESIEQLTALRTSIERESDAARSSRSRVGKAFAVYVGGE